jgi:hypothetical protein
MLLPRWRRRRQSKLHLPRWRLRRPCGATAKLAAESSLARKARVRRPARPTLSRRDRNVPICTECKLRSTRRRRGGERDSETGRVDHSGSCGEASGLPRPTAAAGCPRHLPSPAQLRPLGVERRDGAPHRRRRRHGLHRHRQRAHIHAVDRVCRRRLSRAWIFCRLVPEAEAGLTAPPWRASLLS